MMKSWNLQNQRRYMTGTKLGPLGTNLERQDSLGKLSLAVEGMIRVAFEPIRQSALASCLTAMPHSHASTHASSCRLMPHHASWPPREFQPPGFVHDRHQGRCHCGIRGGSESRSRQWMAMATSHGNMLTSSTWPWQNWWLHVACVRQLK